MSFKRSLNRSRISQIQAQARAIPPEQRGALIESLVDAQDEYLQAAASQSKSRVGDFVLLLLDPNDADAQTYWIKGVLPAMGLGAQAAATNEQVIICAIPRHVLIRGRQLDGREGDVSRLQNVPAGHFPVFVVAYGSSWVGHVAHRQAQPTASS